MSGIGIGENFAAIGADDGAGGVVVGVGNITLAGTNEGSVSVQSGAGIEFADGSTLAGGASAGISALGASAGISFTGITGSQSVPALAAAGGEAISQTSANTGTVTVDGARIESETGDTGTGPIAGGVASGLSIGATGAAASIGLRALNSTNFATEGAGIGTVSASAASNAGDVSVAGSRIVSGALDGVSAQVSMGATGAASTVNSTALGSTGGGVALAGVNMTASSTGNVGVATGSVAVGEIRGAAASAGVNALGAGVSLSSAMIGSQGAGATTGDIAQDASSGTAGGPAGVAVSGSSLSAEGISGAGASAAISAAGVSAGVSALHVAGAGDVTAGAGFGAITQGTDAATRGVRNLGAVDVSDVTLSPGALTGIAASASIGGSGASAGVSSAAYANDHGVAGSSFGDIGQYLFNDGAVNVGTASGGVALGVTGLAGVAASASITARGASAVVGATELAGTGGPAGASSFGTIVQDVINDGAIAIGANAAITGTGGLTGIASSASIAATGASAAFSIAGIANAGGMLPTELAALNQTAVNSASVSNAGAISLGGGGLGTAASAGISALGASASVGMTAIAGP